MRRFSFRAGSSALDSLPSICSAESAALVGKRWSTLGLALSGFVAFNWFLKPGAKIKYACSQRKPEALDRIVSVHDVGLAVSSIQMLNSVNRAGFPNTPVWWMHTFGLSLPRDGRVGISLTPSFGVAKDLTLLERACQVCAQPDGSTPGVYQPLVEVDQKGHRRTVTQCPRCHKDYRDEILEASLTPARHTAVNHSAKNAYAEWEVDHQKEPWLAQLSVNFRTTYGRIPLNPSQIEPKIWSPRPMLLTTLKDDPTRTFYLLANTRCPTDRLEGMFLNFEDYFESQPPAAGGCCGRVMVVRDSACTQFANGRWSYNLAAASPRIPGWCIELNSERGDWHFDEELQKWVGYPRCADGVDETTTREIVTVSYEKVDLTQQGAAQAAQPAKPAKHAETVVKGFDELAVVSAGSEMQSATLHPDASTPTLIDGGTVPVELDRLLITQTQGAVPVDNRDYAVAQSPLVTPELAPA